MTTLVIHPKDRTTNFLKRIYKDIPNKTVITGGTDRQSIIQLIGMHDRILLMGHGSPNGLFTAGQFEFNTPGMLSSSYVIGDGCVEALRKKDNVLYLWCNADRFVNYHKLKGLYSGMFISETDEARYCRVKANQTQVTESNDLFAYLLGEQLATSKPLNEIHQIVKSLYSEMAEYNSVAEYNNNRWYYA